MSDSWINGEQVSSDIENICQIDFGSEDALSYSCKSKTSNGQDSDGINYYSYPRKPTPSPNINHYAVLEKPGINRSVMRGCFTTTLEMDEPYWNRNKPITSPDGTPARDAEGNIMRINTPTTEICDDYKGTFCSNPYSKRKCKTEAPGGLADFTHPMRALGEDFLDNGFILDRCECSLKTKELETAPLDKGCALLTSNIGDMPVDYTCWADKRYRTCDHDVLVDEWTTSCCDADAHATCMNRGYEIGNSSFSGKFGDFHDIHMSGCNSLDFGGKNFTSYQPSELWDGRQKDGTYTDTKYAECHDWYNPTTEELPLGQKDKNNCTQYLLKWAHSCKWCRDNTIGTRDGLKTCDKPSEGCGSSRVCAGECTDNLIFPGKSCNLTYKPECKICDSPLWDQVPGGWEALVDKDHPKHEMALFSYVPKLLKFDGNEQPTTGLMTNGRPSAPHEENEDREGGAKTVTSFIGLGPYVDEAIIREGRGRNDFKDNQTSAVSTSQEYNWVNNIELGPTGETNMTHPRCSGSSGNAVSPNNNSIWDGHFLSSYRNSNIHRIENCEYKNPTIDPKQNPRAHTVCERNPNLTGYGECDADTDYYARLWLDGKWDLSKYTGNTELIDEGLTQEELNQRRLEGLRCCLGLTPDFVSTDGNGIEIPESVRQNLTDTDKEYKRYKYCRPGLTCPSSNACQELFRKYMSLEWQSSSGGFSLYKFGTEYPENYSLNGNDQTSPQTMQDPTYYIKAYCEMMGGGAGGVSSDYSDCAREKESEADCRRLMYNYCSTPVQVDLQGNLDDLNVNRIEYPLRVFTDSCYEWCKESSFGRSLTKALPSQKGVCDMSVGKACQQLQVDGWIDPDNWNGSKILEFADSEGRWYEDGDNTKVHSGLTGDRLRKVCGCFLLGAECGNDNCSVTYCGAGGGGEKGPGPIRINIDWNDVDNYNENNPINRTIYDMRNVYDFQGPRQSNQWEENIDPIDFKCTSRGSRIDDNRCFKGCNYVNTNDTCWMASPEERQQDTLYEGFKDIDIWECDGDKGVGDNCGTYNGKYGCFGNCNMDNYIVGSEVMGRCGTDEWFNEQMNINPAEKEYKYLKKFYDENNIDAKPNRSRNWPKWQNFYSERRNIPGVFQPGENNTEVNVPGWGSYTTDSNGLPRKYGSVDDPVCFYSSCADPDSLKPYRELLKGNTTCGNNCSINLQTTINNQGIVVGSIISSLNASNSCNIQTPDWKPNALVNSNNQREYIALMGNTDCKSTLNEIREEGVNCNLCTPDSTSPSCTKCNSLLQCVHGSEVCINSENGDNCQLCRDGKPNICCLSPNENPYDPNSEEYITWENQNEYLIRNTSNYVSYICDSDCPEGSVPLEQLVDKCGVGCDNRNSQETCQECAYCTWVPGNPDLGTESRCSPMCPMAPSGVGWNIQMPDSQTNPPQPEPTGVPIVVTNPPSTQEPKSSTMSGGTVAVIAVTGVGVFVFIGIIIYILIKSKSKRKVSN